MNNCTSCHSDTYISNAICYCNSGLFRNGDICSSCSSQCQTCQITSTTCLTCNNTHATILNGTQCICPDDKYMSPTDNTCYSCHLFCATCISGVIDGCLSCNSLLYRVISNTSCVCMVKFY